MAGTVLVDTGFLVALLSRRDANHAWASAQLNPLPPPWQTCDAVLSETFYLLGPNGFSSLSALMTRGALLSTFRVDDSLEEVLSLMAKYSDIPMSFADACLVRMTEILSDPTLLTTDSDFRIYRRLGRKAVPIVMPE